MILLKDHNNKLKEFFERKNYTELENLVETFGDLNKLPTYVLDIYATSKALNNKSKKRDYKISAFYFEKIYSRDKSNKNAFYNLIVVSVKATFFGYLEGHIIQEYATNKKDPKVLEGLAKMYFFYNEMDKVTFYYEKLLEINPKPINIWSSFLASLNYHLKYDQNKYLEFCKKFDNSNKITANTFKEIKKKNKRIKIGFLSSDFKNHSVSLFLNTFLNKLDKKEFEIVALSNLDLSLNDDMTENLKRVFDEWYDIHSLTDEKLIKFTRSLNLNVIIDLSGFTFNNRINMLRSRCAKVQISWLGYCNSLGVRNIDYIISDQNLIKKNEEDQYTEKVLYMPNIWNCLSKPNYLPEITNSKNNFTYGSFNNFQKISFETIKVWSKILNKTNAKLILKSSFSSDENKSTEILLEKFKKYNVDLNKINILKTTKTIGEHLNCFNEIDVSLDTFPYPGVTTSFQSILMGVPVLTMRGFNFNSRCGESINKNLNLDHFIAKNENDYFIKALDLSKKKMSLEQKKELRSKALKSNLFDISTFTKDFSTIIKSL